MSGSCAQHMENMEKNRKKFSVLHIAVNIRQNCQRDIVDDRVNGKALHQPVELLRR